MTTTETTEAPVEVLDEDAGELRVRFPVLVIENFDTSDGRFLEEGSLSHRALPITLLAQPESSHGGDEPGPSIAVGRIDTLERIPGPEVVSAKTGEPFPEGVFIWTGTGALSTTAEYKGQNISDMVKRRYLRGVSVDLVGMDYEILGEDGYGEIDPAHPRRQLVTHSAEIAAATLVCVPAFGDAYVELDGADAPGEVPAELVASAVPSWRSAEVGDDVHLPFAITAAGAIEVDVPEDAVQQLVAVIDTGETRDAEDLAAAILEHITANWTVGAEQADPADAGEEAAMADAEPALPDEEKADQGWPDEPQDCEFGEHPAVRSLLFMGGEAFVAVCDEHEQQARDVIAEQGDEVFDVVEINQAEEDDSVPAEVPV